MLPLTWSMAAPQPLYKAMFPSLALKKQKEHKVNKSLLIWAALKMLPGGRWQQLPAPCLKSGSASRGLVKQKSGVDRMSIDSHLLAEGGT